MNRTITETIQQTTERRKKRITWGEEVVDNENMNKKSSKICCIFNSKKRGCRHNKNKYERV